jgi:hypothetical protein
MELECLLLTLTLDILRPRLSTTPALTLQSGRRSSRATHNVQKCTDSRPAEVSGSLNAERRPDYGENHMLFIGGVVTVLIAVVSSPECGCHVA